MPLSLFRRKIQKLLSKADVKIGGNRPWDIEVHNNEFYRKICLGGSFALGQTYMDGWWDCPRLDEFFNRILRARLDRKVKSCSRYLQEMKTKLFNRQKPSRSFEVGEHHYDIGNALYHHMLDRRMIYSCGYWESASTLEEAQEAKLDLICRKLNLRPGMRVLDIGCGWAGTAKFAAERYQVKVVGITVSREQAQLGQEMCRGLPVDIRLQDYRNLSEKFERILSVGMFEHVGYKNYKTFMGVVRNCLKDDGLFLLHTIGGNVSVTRIDPWIEHYIFPNSMLPSPKQITAAIEGFFVLEDWHNFGADYDTTLMHWFNNFHGNWERLKNSYDTVFYRMWKYYLLSCAGSFRSRRNQLWQIVLSPRGLPGGYRSPRFTKEVSKTGAGYGASGDKTLLAA